ncbi:MAG TPA: hypothetical protein VIT19_00145 [Pyrinomonadaceae bacterium]
MTKYIIISAILLASGMSATAQTITVSPSETTVYSQGATSVLLTFGNLGGRRPTESTWCGALIPAAPDIGMKCNPTVIFGRLPVRYNQSRLSGTNAYTDIMSVTPSVARRAYLDATRGSTATFFYVRRFVLPSGGPDEYVPVTLRLGGNGAAVPFSITNVRLLWDGGNKTVPFVKSGEALPRITAEIFYTGSGRLIGRWEIVKPGETAPTQRDLLPEASLPVEERGTQRRFTQVKRFNVFLPPLGRTTIPGPENQRIEKTVDGMYLLLLRIEAVTEGVGRSDLQAVNAGQGTLNSGGASGFAMPVLRYYVGTGGAQVDEFNAIDYQLAPADLAEFGASQQVVFTWPAVSQATYYRLIIEDATGTEVLSAVLLRDTHSYRAPSWLLSQTNTNQLRWRVTAFDANRVKLTETVTRTLRRVAE